MSLLVAFRSDENVRQEFDVKILACQEQRAEHYVALSSCAAEQLAKDIQKQMDTSLTEERSSISIKVASALIYAAPQSGCSSLLLPVRQSYACDL